MVTKSSPIRTIGYWASMAIMFVVLFLAPHKLSSFNLSLLGKFLTYAIVALGLDLIWGYGGMLSLGQGLFFGLGAYCFAMYLKLEASDGQLPDFMSWSGATALPAIWKPFHSPFAAVSLAILVPALVASLIGFLIFRSRVTGVYFSIITQALALITSILFVGQQAVTGGTNGITDFSTIFGKDINDPATQVQIYKVTVVCLALAFVFCKALTMSRFGRLLVAMRDDENRVRFLGYNPVVLKTIAFAVSAALAGLAGMLFVPQVGIISPSQMDVVPSIEMIVWVAVGGRGTLVGAILGALLVNWGKSSFIDAHPDQWQYFMGALFIGTVLLFPLGVVGSVQNLFAWVTNRTRRKTAAPEFPETPGPAAIAADSEGGVEATV